MCVCVRGGGGGGQKNNTVRNDARTIHNRQLPPGLESVAGEHLELRLDNKHSFRQYSVALANFSSVYKSVWRDFCCYGPREG